MVAEGLLLTISSRKFWDKIRIGQRLPPQPANKDKPALPDRVTWGLRREGRIRAPYPSFMLDRALRLLGRRAFDNDFTDDGG